MRAAAVFLALIDQLIKRWALTRLPEEGDRLRLPFDFSLHKNYGIFFDLPVPLWLVIPTSVVLIMALVKMLKERSSSRMMNTALLFLVVGAVGNLWDRIWYGFTVDYLILFGRGAINLSDFMIFTGIGLLFYEYCRHRSRQNRQR